MNGGDVKMIQALNLVKTSIHQSSVTDVFRRNAVRCSTTPSGALKRRFVDYP